VAASVRSKSLSPAIADSSCPGPALKIARKTFVEAIIDDRA